jgi:prepilin-type N-terminal cleavage/methylation domain-containing protein
MENKKINSMSGRRVSYGFTLVELLVVIAIIGILAALITNLAGGASTARKKSRVTAELAQLETAIDSYKDKKGFYPPANADTNNAVTNQLFYELSGSVYTPKGQVDKGVFQTLKGSEAIVSSMVNTYFGVAGFANSSTDKAEVKNFFPGMATSQFQEIVSTPDEVELLVVPVEGPNDITTQKGKKINTWRYKMPGTHNPESYDLWADIVIAGKTNTIGNWKE